MSRANLLRSTGWQSRVLLGALSLCAIAVAMGFAVPDAHAQTQGAPAIRVESHEVLVPVLVVDKKRLKAVHEMDWKSYSRQLNDPNSHSLQDLAVTGLSAADFRVFEDGKEQRIERVTPKDVAMFGDDSAPGIGPVYESGSPDNPTAEKFVRAPVWPAYVVAYSQPPSADGSCHKVGIRVDRPDSVVYTRSEYCNTTHAPNDSLNGMKLGNELLEDLESSKVGGLAFFAVTFPSLHAAGASYTDIVLDAPEKPRSLADCDKLPEIGVLGLVYSADGNLAARFSGLTLGDASQHGQSWFSPLPARTARGPVSCTISGARTFHARVDLPSGEYKLRAVIRDGSRLGRLEVPITVDQLEGTQLAVSTIVLSRRYRQVPDAVRDTLAVSPGRYVPLISKGWEIIPTADTTFEAAEYFSFYVEVYSPVQSAPPDRLVQLRMRIVADGTGQVVKQLRPIDAGSYYQPGNPVIPIGGGVNISGLGSGSYRLEVQAADSSGQSTAWRSVAFRIE